MANEEIVTGLRNAIEHGDSLQNAMQIMMNSGYNPAEVQEASQFFGGGILSAHQQKPEEQLTMPNQKPGVFSRLKQGPPQVQQSIQKTQQLTQQTQQPQIQPRKEIQQPMQPLQSLQGQQNSKPLAKQLQGIGPRGKSYAKEIMLVVILLILIGVLITTILLKDTIIGWFA